MRIVTTDKLKPGDLLAKTIFNENSLPLIQSGLQLSKDQIDIIRDLGHNRVYVLDGIDESFEPFARLKEVVSRVISVNVSMEDVKSPNPQARDFLKDENVKIALGKSDALAGLTKNSNYRSRVREAISSASETVLPYLLSIPEKNISEENYSHVINTAIISILMGCEYGYSDYDLKILAISALLNDIGQLMFSELQDKSFASMSKTERAIYREHPVYSMLLLKGSNPEMQDEQVAILQHHEHYNGKGYPQGLTGSTIPPQHPQQNQSDIINRNAAILTLANDYDDLRNRKADALLPFEAACAINERSGKKYNPYMVRTLCGLIQKFPTSSIVRIKSNSSGRSVGFIGIVKSVGEADEGSPVNSILLTHNSRDQEIKPTDTDFSDERHMVLERIE
jgi:HD-GYP domain-containing protein (c-di-GMP phosphodiesterase class II)